MKVMSTGYTRQAEKEIAKTEQRREAPAGQNCSTVVAAFGSKPAFFPGKMLASSPK
jgi:hypothetical protein